MSNTPRTDEAKLWSTNIIGWVIPASKCKELELELNESNKTIRLQHELMTTAEKRGVDKAKEELNEANDRIKRLIGERDTAQRQADSNWRLREEFRELLGTDDVLEAVNVVRGMQERIKQLESENDALRADLLLWSEKEVKP